MSENLAAQIFHAWVYIFLAYLMYLMFVVYRKPKPKTKTEKYRKAFLDLMHEENIKDSTLEDLFSASQSLGLKDKFTDKVVKIKENS